jgi:hypothetical protein
MRTRTAPLPPVDDGDDDDGDGDPDAAGPGACSTESTKAARTAGVPSDDLDWKAAVARAPARPVGRALLAARKLSPATTA